MCDYRGAQEALQASNRLYEHATKLRAKRSQAKVTPPPGCTFAPEVTARARKSGVATGQERFEHLYRNAAATQKKLEIERERVCRTAGVTGGGAEGGCVFGLCVCVAACVCRRVPRCLPHPVPHL